MAQATIGFPIVVMTDTLGQAHFAPLAGNPGEGNDNVCFNGMTKMGFRQTVNGSFASGRDIMERDLGWRFEVVQFNGTIEYTRHEAATA